MTTALSVAFVGLLARVGEFMSLPLPSDPDSEKVATILLGTVPDLVNLFRAIVVSHRLNSSSSSWSSSVESMPREAALCYSSCEYVRCSIFGGGCWGNGNNRNRAATCVATALAGATKLGTEGRDVLFTAVESKKSEIESIVSASCAHFNDIVLGESGGGSGITSSDIRQFWEQLNLVINQSFKIVSMVLSIGVVPVLSRETSAEVAGRLLGEVFIICGCKFIIVLLSSSQLSSSLSAAAAPSLPS